MQADPPFQEVPEEGWCSSCDRSVQSRLVAWTQSLCGAAHAQSSNSDVSPTEGACISLNVGPDLSLRSDGFKSEARKSFGSSMRK